MGQGSTSACFLIIVSMINLLGKRRIVTLPVHLVHTFNREWVSFVTLYMYILIVLCCSVRMIFLSKYIIGPKYCSTDWPCFFHLLSGNPRLCFNCQTTFNLTQAGKCYFLHCVVCVCIFLSGLSLWIRFLITCMQIMQSLFS